MYDDFKSGSDDTSTSESYHEIRNKWHSAEDIRNRKVINKRVGLLQVNITQLIGICTKVQNKHIEPKTSIRKVGGKHSSRDHDAESTKSVRNSDLDIDKVVVENRHAKKVNIYQ